jgi:hypothetical protein
VLTICLWRGTVQGRHDREGKNKEKEWSLGPGPGTYLAELRRPKKSPDFCFSEWCLPGGQNDPTARRSISHPSRASQRHFFKKYFVCGFSGCWTYPRKQNLKVHPSNGEHRWPRTWPGTRVLQQTTCVEMFFLLILWRRRPTYYSQAACALLRLPIALPKHSRTANSRIATKCNKCTSNFQKINIAHKCQNSFPRPVDIFSSPA